ncbi:hypothetical protein PR003_g4085 [Phytophthora rubi]|uniref:Uncharacterized protein n=1 Tax=Phytophthora rubi TaxID=129364 RepID=A0A6A3MJ33_9STRA|nr:hypothetical protein PR002_g9084 [Phytophthora rubi]KAE9036619.1 hypothetical protein PR001_g8739 [Phytophthora rubi]KAE9353014.1 hypothetical protein PR003_g4085 [Phytophthora rubi]
MRTGAHTLPSRREEKSIKKPMEESTRVALEAEIVRRLERCAVMRYEVFAKIELEIAQVEADIRMSGVPMLSRLELLNAGVPHAEVDRLLPLERPLRLD